MEEVKSFICGRSQAFYPWRKSGALFTYEKKAGNAVGAFVNDFQTAGQKEFFIASLFDHAKGIRADPVLF